MPALRDSAPARVRRQIAMGKDVDEARRSLYDGVGDFFDLDAVSYVQDLYMELKLVFGPIDTYDAEGIDGYATKLEALMDPEPRYDNLRRSLRQPARDAESTVASAIYALDEKRTRGTCATATRLKLSPIDCSRSMA